MTTRSAKGPGFVRGLRHGGFVVEGNERYRIPMPMLIPIMPEDPSIPTPDIPCANRVREP